MITIFTTAKPFVGQTGIHQLNAIRSWKALSSDVEILLFGQGEGYSEAARELDLVHIPDVATSEQGTPLVNSMFALAQDRGSSEIVAYVNCDIILLDDFLPNVEKVRMGRFLIVGQRWDLDLDRLRDFDAPGSLEELRENLAKNGVLHPPSGSDYFVFRGGIWANLPDLVVGRAGYDNYLIRHCRVAGTPVIDASETITLIHQNHDYSHHPQGKDGVCTGDEAQLNLRLVRTTDYYFTVLDADYRLTARGVLRNRCRGEWKAYFRSVSVLHRGTAAGKMATAALRLIGRGDRTWSKLRSSFEA